jgi:hypothetical protein
VATAPPPEVQYLDISWQKSLLEEARIGITTIHQVPASPSSRGGRERHHHYLPGSSLQARIGITITHQVSVSPLLEKATIGITTIHQYQPLLS